MLDKVRARRDKLVAFSGHPLLLGQELLGVVAMFSTRALRPEAMTGLGPIVDAIA